MPVNSISRTNYSGDDTQLTQRSTLKSGSSTKSGKQSSSAAKASSGEQQQKKQASKTGASLVTRGATSQTQVRAASSRTTRAITGALTSQSITTEDVGVDFSLSITIKLGNLPQTLALASR